MLRNTILIHTFIALCAHLLVFKATSDMQKSEDLAVRKRRYVAFPEGSSFTVAICTTIGVIGNPNVNFLSYALNWGVAYDLPNETWILAQLHKPKHDRITVSRRDLYNKMQSFFTTVGYNDPKFLSTFICESKNSAISKVDLIAKLFQATFKPFKGIHHNSSVYRDYDNQFLTC